MGPPSYRRYVENVTKKFGLNVKLLGWVPYKELLYIYNAAKVAVVLSYSEGNPLVVPESLACETPVSANERLNFDL